MNEFHERPVQLVWGIAIKRNLCVKYRCLRWKRGKQINYFILN